MAKQKSQAQISVADGEGGMQPIPDLRFDGGEWSVAIEVQAKNAETWMAHLDAEISERGWNSGGQSQLHSAENSGTIVVRTASGQSPPGIEIVWEKPRHAALRIRARSCGSPPLQNSAVADLINSVSKRQRTRQKERAYRQGVLRYHGLPWRGELWLAENLRIGPPSRHPTGVILGPQAAIVNAVVEGIGWSGINTSFQALMHEVRVFLSVVCGLHMEQNKFDQDWICQLDENGRITSSTLGQVGYYEPCATSGLPPAGSAPPIERRTVTRPDPGPIGIWPDMREQWVPDDIEELWRQFGALPPDKHDQFMRAGNAYVVARSMWPDQRTAYAVFLVVACEALKPKGKRYKNANVYDVVASLIESTAGERLKGLRVSPQRVRNRHLHRGELADELLPMITINPFADPSFDEMVRELSHSVRVCMIEYIRRGGAYTFIRLPRGMTRGGFRAGIANFWRRMTGVK